MRRGHGKCNEADQAQRREIAFVLDQGRKLPQQQARERIVSSMDGPRNADDADRNRNEDGKFRKPQALYREYPRTVSGVSGSRTNNKEQLPGKRVEVPPLIVGIAVRLPTEVQRQKINYPGEDEWKRQAALQQQHHHGKYAQQDHVDREDVEELGLILQQENLDDCDLGLVDEIIDPKVLAIGLILEVEGCVTYLRGKDHEYENVCDIELPNPAIDLSGRGDASLPLQSSSVNCGRGVAGNKDEDLGGIGKCNRMQRYIREDVIWNVVDEDEEQRQTPEEVEP